MANTGVMPDYVYTSDEVVKGTGPSIGTVMNTTDPQKGRREWVFCCVAASQNLVEGTVVTIDNANTATIAAAGAPAASAATRLGVVRPSITASASFYVWVQVYGPCSVLATASTLPNVTLTMAATAGRVDDATTSLSAHIAGIYTTASIAGSGLVSAFLNYPRFRGPSATLA